MSDETCPDCGYHTSTEQHCFACGDLSELQVQLTDAERRLAQAERVIAAADVIVTICDRKTDAFDAYKAERAKLGATK